MNKVLLTGNLTKEPNIHESGKVAFLSVATRRDFANKDGEYESDFPTVKVLGEKRVDFVKKWFKKGSSVEVEGRIQTGSYEKDGQKIFTTDIVADNVRFGAKGGNTSTNTDSDSNTGFVDVVGDEEDLPFK